MPYLCLNEAGVTPKRHMARSKAKTNREEEEENVFMQVNRANVKTKAKFWKKGPLCAYVCLENLPKTFGKIFQWLFFPFIASVFSLQQRCTIYLLSNLLHYFTFCYNNCAVFIVHHLSRSRPLSTPITLTVAG